MVMYYSNLQM